MAAAPPLSFASALRKSMKRALARTSLLRGGLSHVAQKQSLRQFAIAELNIIYLFRWRAKYSYAFEH
jgi:hypothetical protein